MSKIISLTDAAISRIQKLLKQKNAPAVFRIAVDDDGCSGKQYVVDVIAKAKENDQAVEITKDLVIYIDPQSIKFLQGSILDCEEKNLGMWQWIFRNPNAKNTCGCGESFSVSDKGK